VYVEPAVGAHAFTCPHCGVHAQHSQSLGFLSSNNNLLPGPHSRGQVRQCSACGDATVFLDGVKIYPARGSAPPAAEDMPGDVRTVYEEAAAVSAASPRAAAALLRTAVEVLVMQELGGEGKLFDAIGKLVRDEKIKPIVARALDIVRVTGNDAVHPGQIRDDDGQDMAADLFELVNLVVESAITEQRKLDGMFANLPERVRSAIAQRDGQGG